MVSPVIRPSDIDVVNLINVDNGSAVTPEQVKLEDIATTTENDRNTVSEVISVPDAPFGGKVQIFYDRWDLQTLFNGPQIWIVASGTPELADAICGINCEYGTTLDSNEFTYVANIEQGYATLTAKPDSAGYTGSIRVNITLQRVPLSERLTTQNLAGFLYPNRNTPSPNNPITTTTEPTGTREIMSRAMNNGELVTSIENQGYPITYPVTVDGDPNGATLGSRLGSSSYMRPKTHFRLTWPRAMTMAEAMDLYDLSIELKSTSATILTLVPTPGANNTWQWLAAGLASGMSISGLGGTRFSATLDWENDNPSTATLNGRLMTMGMRAGSSTGPGVGLSGQLHATLIAKPKLRGKEMRLLLSQQR